jgi:hypothetical protein
MSDSLLRRNDQGVEQVPNSLTGNGSTPAARTEFASALRQWPRTGAPAWSTDIKELHVFRVVPRRWVVERSLGWLLRYRRLVRDYERRTEHHEAMVYWATVLLMTRRPARRSSDVCHPTLGLTAFDRSQISANRLLALPGRKL